MASIAPFFADWLYQNLNNASNRELEKSVHLTLIPTPDEGAIDKALEERMDYAQRISSLVLSLRKKESLRVRQPLQKIMLPILDNKFQDQVEAVKELILSEVNIKEIEYITDTAGVIKKKVKPNFKTLGRKLGKQMKDGAKIIASLDQDAIASIEKSNSYALEVNGESFELSLEDFEIVSEDIPGWQVATDRDITIALDISLTDTLKAEGLARELVNRIQNIRKTQDFNVTDKIVVTIEDHERLRSTISEFSDYISNEVLATGLSLEEHVAGEKIELVDDIAVAIEVRKA